MTWLLTVDPGKNGCGCALWRGDELVQAAYVASSEFQAGNPIGLEAVMRVTHATARAVFDWFWTHVDATACDAARVICELPRTYGGKAKKGDANDNVVPLTLVDGLIVGWLRFPAQLVWPQDWKGTIPKPERQSEPYIVQERVKEHLSPEETARVIWPRNKKLQWDVADAIGIGLAHLRRAFKPIGSAR